MKSSLAFLSLTFALLSTRGLSDSALIGSIEVVSPLNAPTNGTFWMQARPALAPRSGGSTNSLIVITMQPCDRRGSDFYYDEQAMWTEDFGRTWLGPKPEQAWKRTPAADGLIDIVCDVTPQTHRRSQRILATGVTSWLDPKRHQKVWNSESGTAFSVGDPQSRNWTPWQRLVFPAGEKFRVARAGCTQRVDLPDGDILLPIYFQRENSDSSYATVVRCRFDGATLLYVEHGTELTVTNSNRKGRKGVHEPSLALFQGRYFLTLRNDERGYVTVSDDGLHFAAPAPWRFDDGAELGSYNTQQHWITHPKGLFLAYTRRGADNDKVFRNRAPLFIARVDPARLVVERKSERTLLPNLGEAFGNFGVCNVSPGETWVVDCLRLASPATPSLLIAKIHWSTANQLFEK